MIGAGFWALCFAVIFSACICVSAQSSDQNFPTPVTTSEISGTIKVRDVGDSRLTTYYYIFGADQGDLFVNLLTKNFTGDIDVFTQNGLRPVSKIVVYSDLAEAETGRLLYFRKPEKLLLRVQGRAPGDDPASFRIKFGGSFVAAAETAPAPDAPAVKSENQTAVRVNSVGTILEVIPKPSPSPAEVVAERETVAAVTPEEKAETPIRTDPDAVAETEKPPSKPVVIVTDNTPVAEPEEKPSENSLEVPVLLKSKRPARRTPPRRTTARNKKAAAKETVGETTPPAEKAPDPLEKIQLVILFKDGSTIQRPMSEVSRFTVDKGMLTVVSKDGTTGKYSIFDVAKVSIE